MSKALIFVPTGNNPDNFDPRYDASAHWRSKHPNRTYEILSCMYNDFEPNPNSYDHIERGKKDHKWQMVRKVFKTFDYSKYDYIGCIDDDQITDVHNLNKGFELARRFDFRLWQLSMAEGSDVFYDCLKQEKGIDFSETNFIECGVPIFRRDVFEKVLKVLDAWSDFEVGYGMDKAYCDIAQSNAHVVHCASIYHPPRTAYYNSDRTKPMRELSNFMSTIYPKICRELFNRDSLLYDRQVTFNRFKMGIW
jgi:hypothetical protein